MKKDYGEVLARIGFVIVGIWMLVSVLQINTVNYTKKENVKKWNLFYVLGMIEASASQELADYEQTKGINNSVDVWVLDEREKLEVEYLAHAINAEGGAANYISDEMCYCIGSVILNRVKSDLYPNDIISVVTQKGQYSCYGNANWNVPVNERSYQIAEELYMNGSKLPDNVLFQAEFTQGSGVYKQLPIMTGGYMYFCYK